MTRPMKTIHNSETDEIISREMDDTEFAQYEAGQAERAVAEAEAVVKADAKADLLAKLGITADEAKLLLS